MSSQTIAVHLPDGSIREVPAGTTPLEIAHSISPRLAAVSVVARLTPLDGAKPAPAAAEEPGEAAMYATRDEAAPRLVDLSEPLTADTRLDLVTEKDPEALRVVRHSASHVLATAVLELFPETKLGHGPATDSGFFYDFWRPTPFTPEDLKLIEGRMAEVVARDEKFVREYEPRTEGLEKFKAGFAGDTTDADAAFFRDSQVPIALSIFGTKLTQAAWRTKPSWAVVATEDRAIDPKLLHQMATRARAVTEDVKGSHLVFVTQPKAVADVIDKAAQGVGRTVGQTR